MKEEVKIIAKRMILALLGLFPLFGQAQSQVAFPAVKAGYALTFPHDHGAHPEFRTEWWYATGWLRDAQGNDFGFQVTFFRSRPGVQEDNPSAFAPRQLIFAHAAISDARNARLHHDQRAARAVFELAGAREGDTDVWLDDWSLRREGDDYVASIVGREVGLSLRMRPTQPVLLQGENGFSRKGPGSAQSSYYYSRPQLAVSGSITLDGTVIDVWGAAWLDHEWASEVLAEEAQGWDWIGLNLDDGGALMAFRIRRPDGSAYWAGGAHRDAAGELAVFGPGQISFEALRHWQSPRTGAAYPVAMRVRAGAMTIELIPMFDDQEIDARASTGTVYWEGAVTARLDAEIVGRGYLELTGYFTRPPI
ncbi:MAG TPA: carotenoid 1,2-hydratase [Burkholderiales bacterium]|nr:carotenoid 1,2-hydratase [Burkholderiales bacterium]